MRRMRVRSALSAFALLLMFTWGAAACRHEVKPVESWSSTILDGSKLKAAPRDGFICSEHAWAVLWKAWRSPEPVPDLDFSSDLVLVATAGGPNAVSIIPRLGPDGDLTLVVSSSKIGGPGFGYLLARILRSGVHAINGVPVSICR